MPLEFVGRFLSFSQARSSLRGRQLTPLLAETQAFGITQVGFCTSVSSNMRGMVGAEGNATGMAATAAFHC